MYHNGWRENHSEATSSPLVPNLYESYHPDPHTYHSTDQISLVQAHQYQQGYLAPPQHQYAHLNHQPPPMFQHHSAPQADFTSTLAQLAAGQRELFETLTSLNARIDSVQRQLVLTVNQLTNGLNNINLDRHAPPHQTPTVAQVPPPRVPQSYQPVQPSRVSSPSEGHYARDPNRIVFREPKVRENIRFSGDSKLLRQFLLDIYDCLDQFSSDFSSDKRRINWIASHFGSINSDTTPAQSWFSALLMKNTYQHSVTDQYANLKALSYVIPPLLSAEAFINELILVFGDKTSAKTARAALDKCKQGSTSIVDYNSRFGPLAFQVRQHEDDAIIKYVDGLHPDVREECINVLGWSEAKTLAEKMNLAVEGAGRADERASLPNQSNRPKLYQHPNKHHINPYLTTVVTPPITQTVSVPVPMQVDAVVAKYSNQKNPFSAIRSVCLKRGLCFKCIQPFDADTHMVNGERRCPNKNATLSEKIALLSPPNTEEKVSSKVHQIAALSFEDQVKQEDNQALAELGESEREAVEWLLESYCSGLSEPTYPSPTDLLEGVDVCAVKMEADSSNPRRVHVPMTLVEEGLAVPVMVLGDTGSETNLLDDRFAAAHGMTLIEKDFPLTCTGYDGSRGLEIRFEWRGRL